MYDLKSAGIPVILFPLFLLFAGCKNQAPEGKTDPPLNVILITSDDMGKQIGCYGDHTIQTPNLDQLAARGMMFHNGYVTQASCSSSRSSILTGTWPHVNGQIGLAHHGFNLNGSYPNIARSLRAQGYKSAVLGKIHVRPEEQFPFDYYWKKTQETRSVELVVSRVDSFLNAIEDNPFFLYLNYTDPHTPFTLNIDGHPKEPVTAADVSAFPFQGVDDPEELERIAGYYTCVKRVDEGVGLLLEMLDERGVLEHSIIMYVGDHGAPFSRGKGACYESSTNIPFFISCPGITGPGKETDALASTADLYPTLMDLLGLEIPEGVQGKSLVPVLKGESEGIREYLFTEFNHHGASLRSFFPRRTIRDERYKLIYNVAAEIMSNDMTGMDGDKAYNLSQAARYEGTWVREIFDRFHQPPLIELYDLQQDPYEKINLAGEPALKDIEETLRSTLESWMEETDDLYRDLDAIRAEIAYRSTL